jgi:hypothetical protein
VNTEVVALDDGRLAIPLTADQARSMRLAATDEVAVTVHDGQMGATTISPYEHLSGAEIRAEINR